jgi:hypothetical protein
MECIECIEQAGEPIGWYYVTNNQLAVMGTHCCMVA